MDFNKALAFFKNRVQQQESNNSNVERLPAYQNKNNQPKRSITRNVQPISTPSSPPKAVEKKIIDQDSKSNFAKNLAFFKNNESQNSQSSQVPNRDTTRSLQHNSNFAGRLNTYNNLHVVLGQPYDYRGRIRSNYQPDDNAQPQMVFPSELISEEDQEMPFRRSVRFSSGRRRPTYILDE